MIVRTWSGKVPLGKAEGFHRHLLATGVKDYRCRAGCLDIALWRRDEDGWAVFTLVSTWSDVETIRAYAGHDLERAMLYPDDQSFDLVPDLRAHHHQLVSSVE